MLPASPPQVLASVLDDVFPIEGARRVVKEATMYVDPKRPCLAP
jgi:hypothetical protein